MKKKLWFLDIDIQYVFCKCDFTQLNRNAIAIIDRSYSLHKSLYSCRIFYYNSIYSAWAILFSCNKFWTKYLICVMIDLLIHSVTFGRYVSWILIDFNSCNFLFLLCNTGPVRPFNRYSYLLLLFTKKKVNAI